MHRKAIFLDVDGTLVNESGVVPGSARDAIRSARRNGHLVFLCSGRSVVDLWPEILDVGFDGVIAGGGAYVEADGQVLVRRLISPDDVLRVVDYFDQHEVHYLLESNDGLYASRGVPALLAQLADASRREAADTMTGRLRAIDAYSRSIITGWTAPPTTVHKITFLAPQLELSVIQQRVGDTFHAFPSIAHVFGPTSGEVAIAGVHKAAGMQVIGDHFAVERVDMIALGDGYNDLEMLEFAGVGIAMANAPQAVLDVAQEQTSAPDDDGIRLAFERHGLTQSAVELDRTTSCGAVR